jgi:ribonuclease Z
MEIKYSYQNNGETYLKVKVGSQNYTIRGYSRAGLRTCILIDELNLVLDMGYANDRAFSYDNKLISHGHNDHIGALHADHCARRLYNIEKEKLFIMPKQCIKPFKMIAAAVSEMNCGKSGDNIKMFDTLLSTNIVESEWCVGSENMINLIGSSKLSSEYWVKSIQMDHKIKSFGYIIYRKSKRLKPEYANLKGSEIIQLKQEIGEDNLTNSIFTPMVAYTGDTSIKGVISNPELLNVPLLIMECTGFSSDDKCYCCEGKHIHWEDLVENQHLFSNEKIMLFHFSQQYKTVDDISSLNNNVTKQFANKLIYFF